MNVTRVALLISLSVASVSARGADDAATRLRHVRSLRCTYTVEEQTAFMPQGRRISTDHDILNVIYDSIDLQRGTARVIYEKGIERGADDVSVRWHGNALWFIEVVKASAIASNAISTSVFARYAEGTNDFIALDSRQYRNDRLTTVGTAVTRSTVAPRAPE